MNTRVPAFRSMLLVLLAAAATQGCAADDEEDSDARADEAAVSAALPIKGEWALAAWQGHYTTTRGSQVELHEVRKVFDARAREGATTLDLDSDGDGSIRGIVHCQPALPGERVVESMPAAPVGNAMQLAKSVVSIVVQAIKLTDTARCDTTQGQEKTLYAYSKRNFIGQPSRDLWANLGVYGEASGARAADKECRTLRGVRWMSFVDGTAACAGYADASARTVKMLVQRPGEIYVQRLVLRRPSDP